MRTKSTNKKKRETNKRSTNKTNTTKSNSTNSVNSMDRMKYEIASEFGVSLGADATSRANGSVGGEITKRLVKSGMDKKKKKNKRN